MADQIATVSKLRLRRRISRIVAVDMTAVDRAIRIPLALSTHASMRPPSSTTMLPVM